MKRFLIVAGAIFSLAGFAQMERLTSAERTEAESAGGEQKNGWKLGLDVSLTGSYSYNNKFVGIRDGNYFSTGGKIRTFATLKLGKHEWFNRLSVLETWTKTPSVPQFEKSADEFGFVTEYTYMFLPYLGAFAQANLDTAIFEGWNVESSPKTYIITEVDGSTRTEVAQVFKLTDAFAPLNLKQAVGLYFVPFKGNFSFEAKAAWMFRETFANNQLILTSETDAAFFLKTLADFFQMGPALYAYSSLLMFEERVKLHALFETMYVAVRNSVIPLEPDNFENRYNYQVEAGVDIKLNDLISVNWDMKGIKIPDISKDFQFQSNLLLTFSFST